MTYPRPLKTEKEIASAARWVHMMDDLPSYHYSLDHVRDAELDAIESIREHGVIEIDAGAPDFWWRDDSLSHRGALRALHKRKREEAQKESWDIYSNRRERDAD
jgi:hypothetical protein